MIKKGVLLINLGTPDSPEKKSVYRYLKQFLNDPRVIDLPLIFRWLLLYVVILPTRPKKSAQAYQKIWTTSGSPLLVHSTQLKNALALALGENYQVELGMRYGNPSIEHSLSHFTHCDEITIIPLFPQYASSATGSAIQKTLSIIEKKWNIPSLTIKNGFYNHPKFIKAYADNIKKHATNVDLILLSYHGLPVRHINKSQCVAKCNGLNACPAINENNIFCYRAQCYETSRLIEQQLNLGQVQYKTAFQSRLGTTPWIKPYTDILLKELIEQGIKNIAVVCPSFVADCLETIEEIGIRAKKDWQALGGSELILVPCLNDHPLWISALVDLVN